MQLAVSRRAGIWLFLALAAALGIAALLVPETDLPPSYHHFADQREWLGIPHFGDVASNVVYFIVGLWGLAFLSGKSGVGQFVDARERWPYLVVFLGLVLTAFGSAYYHLAPDNDRLVWDRLPMTIVFMPFVAALIAERVSVKLGLWLLPILTATASPACFNGIILSNTGLATCASLERCSCTPCLRSSLHCCCLRATPAVPICLS